MPRKSAHLADPMRRRVGDHIVESRAYHLAQAQKREADAVGLAARVRHQIAAIRHEAHWHAEQAEAAREIAEALA